MTAFKTALLLTLAATLAVGVLHAQSADATSSASTQKTPDATSSASSQKAHDAASSASSQRQTPALAQGVRPGLKINLYDLALGPLFIAAWFLFVLGFAWRIVVFRRRTRAIAAPVVPPPPSSKDDLEFLLKGRNRLGRLLFLVRRWAGRTIFGTNPVMGIMSLVFHVLLFLVPLFLPAHNQLLARSLGGSLPSLPVDLMDLLTLVFIAVGGLFLLRRILLPPVRALTTVRDYLILILVAAPFVSAYLAHHRVLDYSTVVLIHMFVGDIVIGAIPFTRLGHMPFLLLARFFIAGEYAWRPANRRW